MYYSQIVAIIKIREKLVCTNYTCTAIALESHLHALEILFVGVRRVQFKKNNDHRLKMVKNFVNIHRYFVNAEDVHRESNKINQKKSIKRCLKLCVDLRFLHYVLKFLSFYHCHWSVDQPPRNPTLLMAVTVRSTHTTITIMIYYLRIVCLINNRIAAKYVKHYLFLFKMYSFSLNTTLKSIDFKDLFLEYSRVMSISMASDVFKTYHF